MPPLLRLRLPLSPHPCHLSLRRRWTFIPRFPPIKMSSTSSNPNSNPNPNTNTNPNPNHEHQNLRQVIKYHNQTKHSFTHYSKGPRGLDWANQPIPFRRYPPSSLLPLSISFTISPIPYLLPFTSLPSPEPISKSTLSHFLFHSLALSAWKTTGFSTWSLRVNPSSGNLHPTEAYIISPPIDTLCSSPFVAHYAPKEHSLELRTRIPDSFFPRFFPKGSFLVGFSSIFWREAWKYGERAFRYCNHDVGHAVAAVSFAAAELGWDVRVLDGLGFRELEKLMGLGFVQELKIPSRPVKKKMPEIEFEHPDCVLLIFQNGVGEFDIDYQGLSEGIAEFQNLEWVGEPNLLSEEHICWDIIYRTAEAVKKPLEVGEKFVIEPFRRSGLVSEESYKGFTVGEVVRKRRSAVDMDGVTAMERETFYQILLHCLPSGYVEGGKQGKQMAFPFRAMPWDSQVHCALFIHRVVGLEKGLYFLVRNEDHFDDLKKSMRSEFEWEKPEGCPDELPLYVLMELDCRELSKRLSCHQDIASDGCFSLGMVPHFEPTLRSKGVWMYPRLFWETGVLGQVLYLEAHAIGISATGIGCFFDDPVHEVLGLRGSNYQSLYHFTVGGPVVDKRIMSLPAYPGPNIDA